MGAGMCLNALYKLLSILELVCDCALYGIKMRCGMCLNALYRIFLK